jgi:hypothetical protein
MRRLGVLRPLGEAALLRVFSGSVVEHCISVIKTDL